VFTFDDMQQRVIQLLTLGGWSNGFPAPNPAALVQYGKQEFIRYTNTNQETAIIQTVPNQAVYNMISDILPVGQPIGDRMWLSWNDDALWNISQSIVGQGSYFPQTTRQKLRKVDVQYLDIPSSVPQAWYVAEPQKIGLYPPPADGGILIQFSGNRDLPDLQAEDDTLPWLDRYIEAVCLLGAYYFAKPIARGEELGTLARYHAEAMDLVKEFNQDSVDQEAALINRYVCMPRTGYLDNGNRYFPWYRTPDGYFPNQG